MAKRSFPGGAKQESPSGQGGPILAARVANQNTAFPTSCPTSRNSELNI